MREQWTDDEIIGAILAGSRASDRPLKACMWFGSGFDGPVCAVSAGVLWRDAIADVSGCDSEDAVHLFAAKYDVTLSTAIGVSDGFEWNGAPLPESKLGTWTDDGFINLYDGTPISGDEYERGWAIGAAVRAAIETDESEVSP